MKRTAILAVLPGVLCMAALAQDPHAGHQMPPPAGAADAGTSEQLSTGDSQPAGNAPAPPVIDDNIADRVYDSARMDRARAVLAEEHGGGRISKVIGNLFEYTSTSDGSGYRWDAEAWYGGDRHRFVFKTEGDGMRREELANAEVQALYSRAVGRYTDVQAGLRYELQPDGRAYGTVAVESLLPYWFKVQAALFVSDRGDAFSRLEGSYDLRLTQRLILQPRAEVLLAAQNVPDINIGAGFSSAEMGLRLRYEFSREFAPYIGVNFERRLGRTADFFRTAGEDVEDTSLVLGLRAWF
jgi:copper resistance protein B